jgi:hypothetical protein
MNDLTIMLAIDDQHLTELIYSFRTWKHFYPQFFTEHSYCIVYDEEQIKTSDKRFDMFKGLKYEMFPWKNFNNLYVNQREKMLTSLVAAPAEYIKTKWYLKIDTDTIATRSDKWIEEEWFEDGKSVNEQNMFISNPWGYTKPPNAIDIMDDWADNISDVKNHYPRLDIHPKDGADAVSHDRIISWIMLARTEWTKWIASYAKTKDGFYKLPIPSQDTYVIYFAQRMKFNYNRVRFKKFGWDHLRFKNLKKKYEEIFNGQ